MRPGLERPTSIATLEVRRGVPRRGVRLADPFGPRRSRAGRSKSPSSDGDDRNQRKAFLNSDRRRRGLLSCPLALSPPRSRM